VTFTDNHDGTASLSGTPGPSTGVYVLTLIAGNGAGVASQAFALTVVDPPRITSPGTASFTVGTQSTFIITTSPGLPLKTTVSESGKLPAGITFKPTKNGTATLTGKPAAYTGGVYPITIAASNGAGPAATQSFTLVVNGSAAQAPTITSANNAAFAVGTAGSFTITASPGTPGETTLTESGPLPEGVVFSPQPNGTAQLAGMPSAGTGGTYPVTITASNGIVSTTKSFTLTVSGAAAPPPTITTGNRATFTVGQAGTFTVATLPGTPTKTTLTEAGALPVGVTFTSGARGTGRLHGTPRANTGGAYTITLRASNGLTWSTQTFTLVVAQPPAITSPLAIGLTDFIDDSVTITTSGFPRPTLSVAGGDRLPTGMSFVDNGDGTATLSGTSTAAPGVTYVNLRITAHNGVGADSTQKVTLHLGHSPIFATASTAAFLPGQATSFTIMTSAAPAATLTVSGNLPRGIRFHDNGDGTATLSGKPANNLRGTYTFVIVASSPAFPEAFQLFTLTVGSPA
jgi:hypothetical protein